MVITDYHIMLWNLYVHICIVFFNGPISAIFNASDEGSSSVLTGHFVNQTLENVGRDDRVSYDTIGEPAVYLLAHRGKFNDLKFPQGSIILDVWRECRASQNRAHLITDSGDTAME